MFCIGWESAYEQDREFGGTTTRQKVFEFLITTEHGLVHYKVCEYRNGRVKVFTDLDLGFAIRNTSAPSNEQVKRHKQWMMMRNASSRHGGTINYIPYANTDDVFFHRDKLRTALAADEKARNAWKTVLGHDMGPKLGDILDKAEEITAGQRAVVQREKCLEMATVDDTWGMF